MIRLNRNPAQAVKTFDEVLSKDGDHYGALYQRATALERAGQMTEALAAWRTFLKAAEASKDVKRVAQAKARISELEKPAEEAELEKP